MCWRTALKKPSRLSDIKRSVRPAAWAIFIEPPPTNTPTVIITAEAAWQKHNPSGYNGRSFFNLQHLVTESKLRSLLKTLHDSDSNSATGFKYPSHLSPFYRHLNSVFSGFHIPSVCTSRGFIHTSVFYFLCLIPDSS